MITLADVQRILAAASEVSRSCEAAAKAYEAAGEASGHVSAALVEMGEAIEVLMPRPPRDEPTTAPKGVH
jgi:hypothetical protein